MRSRKGREGSQVNAQDVSPVDYFKRLTLDRADVLGSWLSKSSLWELNGCSLYKWRYAPKQTTTKAMNHGSLIDVITTTPELVGEMINILPFKDLRSKEAREWKADAEESGILVVKEDELELAMKAAAVLTEKHEGSAALFEKSKTQVVLLGERRGAKLRGLVDLAPEGENYLADLKTTADFSLEGFGKTIAKFGYHVQAGLYLALWNVQHPDDQREGFRFVWQDSKHPFEVCITELGGFDIAAGIDYADFLTSRIVNAAKRNHWPMLEQGRIPMVGRPAWASMAEDEMMEATLTAPSRGK